MDISPNYAFAMTWDQCTIRKSQYYFVFSEGGETPHY